MNNTELKDDGININIVPYNEDNLLNSIVRSKKAPVEEDDDDQLQIGQQILELSRKDDALKAKRKDESYITVLSVMKNPNLILSDERTLLIHDPEAAPESDAFQIQGANTHYLEDKHGNVMRVWQDRKNNITKQHLIHTAVDLDGNSSEFDFQSAVNIDDQNTSMCIYDNTTNTNIITTYNDPLEIAYLNKIQYFGYDNSVFFGMRQIVTDEEIAEEIEDDESNGFVKAARGFTDTLANITTGAGNYILNTLMKAQYRGATRAEVLELYKRLRKNVEYYKNLSDEEFKKLIDDEIKLRLGYTERIIGDASREIREAEYEWFRKIGLMKEDDSIYYKLGSTFGSIAMSMLLGNPTIATVVYFMNNQQELEEELNSHGIYGSKAFMLSNATALMSSAVEKIGTEKLFKFIKSDKIFAQVLRSGGSEFAEEFFQNFIEDEMMTKFGPRQKDFDDILLDASEAGIYGFIGGAGTVSVVGAAKWGYDKAIERGASKEEARKVSNKIADVLTNKEVVEEVADALRKESQPETFPGHDMDAAADEVKQRIKNGKAFKDYVAFYDMLDSWDEKQFKQILANRKKELMAAGQNEELADSNIKLFEQIIAKHAANSGVSRVEMYKMYSTVFEKGEAGVDGATTDGYLQAMKPTSKDFSKFYSDSLRGKQTNEYYKYNVNSSNISYDIPENIIRHDSKKHGISENDWKNVLNHINNSNITNYTISNVKNYYGNKHILLNIKIGDENYGVSIATPNGRNIITTLFKDNNDNINFWIDKNKAPATGERDGTTNPPFTGEGNLQVPNVPKDIKAGYTSKEANDTTPSWSPSLDDIINTLKNNVKNNDTTKGGVNSVEEDIKVFYQTSPEFYTTINEVLELAKKEGGTYNKKYKIGKVSEWLAKEAKAKGLDIDGYVHDIDVSAVKHINKKHGNQKVEAARGQIAITDEDIKNIPYILNNPDYIILGTKGSRGQESIIYAKNMPNGSSVYVEEIRCGKNTLSATTMYKRRGAINTANVKNIPANLNARSDTSITIIENPALNVNEKKSEYRVAGATYNANSIKNTLSPTSETLPLQSTDNIIKNPNTKVNSDTNLEQDKVGGATDIRGQIDFSNPEKMIIRLFANSDASTVVHELGHYSMIVTQELAKRGHKVAIDDLLKIKEFVTEGTTGKKIKLKLKTQTEGDAERAVVSKRTTTATTEQDIDLNYSDNPASESSLEQSAKNVKQNSNVSSTQPEVLDLSKEFNYIKSTDEATVAKEVERKLNELIGQAIDTATAPLQVEVKEEHKGHIIHTNVELKHGQKHRHNNAILNLKRIINNAILTNESKVNNNHNSKRGKARKESIELYRYFKTDIIINDVNYEINIATELPKNAKNRNLSDLYNIQVKASKKEDLMSVGNYPALTDKSSDKILHQESENVKQNLNNGEGGADAKAAAENSRVDGVSEYYVDVADVKFSVEELEYFARSFEAYLRNGQTKHKELRSVFRRFREWLYDIYKTLKELNVRFNENTRRFFDEYLDDGGDSKVRHVNDKLGDAIADIDEYTRDVLNQEDGTLTEEEMAQKIAEYREKRLGELQDLIHGAGKDVMDRVKNFKKLTEEEIEALTAGDLGSEELKKERERVNREKALNTNETKKMMGDRISTRELDRLTAKRIELAEETNEQNRAKEKTIEDLNSLIDDMETNESLAEINAKTKEVKKAMVKFGTQKLKDLYIKLKRGDDAIKTFDVEGIDYELSERMLRFYMDVAEGSFIKKKQPLSLNEWIAKRGGVYGADEELRALGREDLIAKEPKNASAEWKRKHGLDAILEEALEEGYLGVNAMFNDVGAQEFLSFIEKDNDNHDVYRVRDMDYVMQQNEARINAKQAQEFLDKLPFDYRDFYSQIHELREQGFFVASKKSIEKLKKDIKAITNEIFRANDNKLKTAREVKAQIIKMINSSGLRKEFKSEFLTELKNINTMEDFARRKQPLIDKINRLLEVQNNYRVVSKLERELDGTKNLKRGGRRVGKYNYETNAIFSELRSIFYMRADSAEKMLLDLEKNTATKDKDSLVYETKSKLLYYKTKGIRGTSNELLNDVLRNVLDLKKLATEQRELTKDKKRVEKMEWIKKTIDNIHSSDFNKKSIFAKMKVQGMETVSNIKDFLREIAGDEAAAKFNLELANSKYAVAVHEKQKRINERIMEVLTEKGKNKKGEFKDEWLLRDYEINSSKPVYELFDRREKEPRLISKAQIMTIYNNLKNEKRRNDFYEAYGEPAINSLLDNLTDKDKRIADILMEEVNMRDNESQYYDYINERHIELYNIDLKKVDNYFPTKSEHEAYDLNDFGMSIEFDPKNQSFSFTKERSGGATIPIVDNVFDVALNHISGVEYIINMGKISKEFAETFFNPDVKLAIETKFGEKVYGILKQLVENQSYNSKAKLVKTVDKAVNKLIGNWAVSAIGANLNVPAKQLSSIIAFNTGVNKKAFWKYFMEGISHPAKTMEYMKKIGFVDERMNSGINRDVKEAIQQGKNNTFSFASILKPFGLEKQGRKLDATNFVEKTTWLVGASDSVSTIYGGYAYLKAQEEMYWKQYESWKKKNPESTPQSSVVNTGNIADRLQDTQLRVDDIVEDKDLKVNDGPKGGDGGIDGEAKTQATAEQSKRAVDLSKEFEYIKLTDRNKIAKEVERKLNELIGKPLDTATGPLQVEIKNKHKGHIQHTNISLRYAQKDRHDSALLSLEKIINSSVFESESAVDSSHNSKSTKKRKERIELYRYFNANVTIDGVDYDVRIATELRKDAKDRNISDLYNIHVKSLSEDLRHAGNDPTLARRPSEGSEDLLSAGSDPTATGNSQSFTSKPSDENLHQKSENVKQNVNDENLEVDKNGPPSLPANNDGSETGDLYSNNKTENLEVNSKKADNLEGFEVENPILYQLVKEQLEQKEKNFDFSGLNEDDIRNVIEQQAVNDFIMKTLDTQQSNYLASMSLVQQESSAMSRLLTVFRSAQFMMIRSINNARLDYKRGKISGFEFARVLANHLILQPFISHMMSKAIKYLFFRWLNDEDDDEEPFHKDLLLTLGEEIVSMYGGFLFGKVGGVLGYIIGQTSASAFYRKITGQRIWEAMNLSALNELQKAVNRILDDDGFEQTAVDIIMDLGKFGLGIPIDNINRYQRQLTGFDLRRDFNE